jgi:hypothetical protein
MCHGGRLIADFVAGTDARPDLPEVLEEHLTPTADGRWVVWAYKLARQDGAFFVPLTDGYRYPADARALCRLRGAHRAPEPACTCGFHALSSRKLPGLRRLAGFGTAALTVALSGRVLGSEWAGGGVLWRAERQTVVRVEEPASVGCMTVMPVKRSYPGDPDGRLSVVAAVPPRDSGPIRLDLPVACPVVQLSDDHAGWCVASRTFERSPRALVLA